MSKTNSMKQLLNLAQRLIQFIIGCGCKKVENKEKPFVYIDERGKKYFNRNCRLLNAEEKDFKSLMDEDLEA